MANKIDCFQPECERLAVPAAAVMVFLDGALCEDLEPVEIIRSGWPEFGWARLVYNPAARANGDVIPPERIEERFSMGTRLSICQSYNAMPPGVTVVYLPLFVGRIERIEMTISGEAETVEIIAKDFSAVLNRITIYGQRVLQNDGSTVFLTGLETSFNSSGRGNAAPQATRVSGAICRFFAASPAQAKMWSCAEAIDYLLREHVPIGELYWPSLEELLALTEKQPVRDLDVTGLSLLEAVHRCCERVGLAFRFMPRLAEPGPEEAITFYREGRGRVVEVNCQERGQSLSLSRTNIGILHVKRDLYPVTHRYMGQGDFKVHEATFELIKAWDPALESTNYATFSRAANPEFYKVKDVYRKWCLNEAGDYTSAPYNQGAPYEFSRAFEDAAWVRRRRRFWPALSTDAQGKSLGYFVEISWDGEHWCTYPGAFDNLLDECGIWLSGDHLDADTWVAALKGALRFRITASVVSDERLTCTFADGPVGSTVPVVDHVFTLPRHFRYRKVSPQSVLGGRDGLGTPSEADDSTALQEFVRGQAMASPALIERLDVQMLSLALYLEPGDRATSSPESRDLLGCRCDNRSVTWISRVHMDFRNQCTDLQLVRQRMYES